MVMKYRTMSLWVTVTGPPWAIWSLKMGMTLPLEPRIMLALCGLTRVSAPPNPSPVRRDAGLDAWVVAATSEGRPLRLYLDRRSLLPVRVEVTDGDGEVAFSGVLKLSRYDRVALAGRPPGSGPRFPTLADLTSVDDRVAVKLSVPSPSDDETLEDRFFDLEELREMFRPVRVEGVAAARQRP